MGVDVEGRPRQDGEPDILETDAKMVVMGIGRSARTYEAIIRSDYDGVVGVVCVGDVLKRSMHDLLAPGVLPGAGVAAGPPRMARRAGLEHLGTNVQLCAQ